MYFFEIRKYLFIDDENTNLKITFANYEKRLQRKKNKG